ncbi:hypothetical protein [Haloprofundus halobius]|uniref:hypothetical protein n=1 Tax=Haloprofundus halobius TaxID=2876194 RepID=UPI001CC9230A|nr:hypothetical protein [Haloprofundus halobius]
MALVFHRRIAKQAEESVIRILPLDELRRRYEDEHGGVAYTKIQLACKLFEQPSLTTKTVTKLFDVEFSMASRAITALEDDGVLEEVTANA